MPEPPNTDDWMLRTDALALVRDVLNCGEDEASRYLTEHLCAQPPSGWRFESWWRVERAAAKSPLPRQRLPDAELIEAGVQTWFWRFLRQFAAPVRLDGNSARYHGPVFIAPVSVEVRPLDIRSDANVIFVNPAWRIALHLRAIGLRAQPLVEALLRCSGAAVVEAALKRLREQGRLAPLVTHQRDSSTPPSLGPSKAVGSLKQRVYAAVPKRKPLPGETMSDWARRVFPDEKVHSILNYLRTARDLWESHGGTPGTPGRKPGTNRGV